MIPVISGTVAGQTVTSGSDINPFANVSITDGNDYIHDTNLTISLLNASGTATDANGTLTLPAGDLGGDTFSETSPGVYVLVDTSAPSPSRNLPHFQPQLSDLTFIPSGGATTTFNLTIVDSYNEHQTDSTTTVTASGAGSSTTPTIGGTTTATVTPSANELTPTSGGTLIDAAGNNWTLTSGGAVDENGTAVPGGSGTSAFAIVGNVLYGQDAGSQSWFTFSPTSQYWTSSAAPTLLAHA